MTTLYHLDALWPLLDFKPGPHPFLGSVDPYGDGDVAYLVDTTGLWLCVADAADPKLDFEAVAGFAPAQLQSMTIGGRAVYGLRGGAPLLPFPFTAQQLWALDRRAGGVVYEGVERGTDEGDGDGTEGWLTDLAQTNPAAVELARVVLSQDPPDPFTPKSASAVVEPVQRRAAQEKAILNTLRDLGYDPKALPRALSGKRSLAKAAVRERLPRYSRAVIDKAWSRLRVSGQIADA